ncbi:MAG: site-2 protease family protein [Pirellulales bacterium]|nr:site-2 protease family protein [Pirellulales bacterium]
MAGCTVQRWSLSLGKWWGVCVHLHIFFLVSALLALVFTLPEPDLVGLGLLMIAVLLASVLLHEVGHAWATLRAGGEVDAIVLGPVGGLVSPRVPDEPESLLFVALAGPIVHLLLASLAALVLALAGNAQLVGLLNPLATPQDLIEPGGILLVAAKMTFWLNWNLMILNLLPAYPFDGGPILRSMLWPAVGRRTARVVTARFAMVLAFGICLFGLYVASLGQDEIVSRFPSWIALVLLGIFLFFSARQDLATASSPDWAEDLLGYQVNSEGLDLLEVNWKPEPEEEEDGVLVEHQQRPSLDENLRDQEALEDARVDDILARLHHSSWAALSADEIAILQRASQRYRRRRQQ